MWMCMDRLFLPDLELDTGLYFHDKNNGLLSMFLYVVYIISTIIINIAVLCCQLVKLNNLYYINMFTRTLVLFTQSQTAHPLIKQSGISNTLVVVPLVLHGMNYRFKFKIQLYTIIKTKSVTIVYVYMYFLFYNVVGICVLMC